MKIEWRNVEHNTWGPEDVPDDDEVKVWYRDGDTAVGAKLSFDWFVFGDSADDIVAYEVVR